MVKIMHVDNEPDTVSLVKTILESESFGVVTAYSGNECLEKLREEKVDLLLLDIMMPDLSGWDVFQRIEKMKHKPKVIFLSVIPISEERKAELMQNGIADYITKPFSPKDLVKKIKTALKK